MTDFTRYYCICGQPADDHFICPPQPRRRYIAHFTPEAWVRDQAVEVDAPGPQEWDCTAYARQHLDYLASTGRHRGEHLAGPAGVLDNDDVFAADPAAPDWVRTWQGPFTIRIRTEHRTVYRVIYAFGSTEVAGIRPYDTREEAQAEASAADDPGCDLAWVEEVTS